jgi:hypothetical protein
MFSTASIALNYTGELVDREMPAFLWQSVIPHLLCRPAGRKELTVAAKGRHQKSAAADGGPYRSIET